MPSGLPQGVKRLESLGIFLFQLLHLPSQRTPQRATFLSPGSALPTKLFFTHIELWIHMRHQTMAPDRQGPLCQRGQVTSLYIKLSQLVTPSCNVSHDGSERFNCGLAGGGVGVEFSLTVSTKSQRALKRQRVLFSMNVLSFFSRLIKWMPSFLLSFIYLSVRVI